MHIANRYPQLLKRFDTAAGDYLEDLQCDAQGMRASQSFKNVLFSNTGRQSALLYFRQRQLEVLEEVAARVQELAR